jgi:hypothetical protein
VQRRKSQLTFCVRESSATLRTPIWVPLLLDPEDVRSLSLGTIRNFIRGTGLPRLGHQITGHKGYA